MFFGPNQPVEQQQEEEKYYSKVEMLLGRIPQLNREKEDKAIFLAPDLNMAYASTLRSARLWGASDLLVRYHGHIDVQVGEVYGNSMDMPNVSNEGMYYPESKDYVHIPGLLGGHTPEGRRMLTPEGTDDVFADIRKGGFDYQLVINPKLFLDYIEDLLSYGPEDTKTISLMPSSYINNKGHFVARLNEEMAIINPRVIAQPIVGDQRSLFVVDSYIEFDENDFGQLFMFEYLGEVQNGFLTERHARLVMPFQPGIHAAIQDYPSGHVLPVFDSYSVIIGEDNNNVNSRTKAVFPFMSSQDKRTQGTGPMLTFALSTFRAALIAMQEFVEVELWYNNSHDKVYMMAVNEYGELPYQVEAIISPLSQYRYGKILTL